MTTLIALGVVYFSAITIVHWFWWLHEDKRFDAMFADCKRLRETLTQLESALDIRQQALDRYSQNLNAYAALLDERASTTPQRVH